MLSVVCLPFLYTLNVKKEIFIEGGETFLTSFPST